MCQACRAEELGDYSLSALLVTASMLARTRTPWLSSWAPGSVIPLRRCTGRLVDPPEPLIGRSAILGRKWLTSRLSGAFVPTTHARLHVRPIYPTIAHTLETRLFGSKPRGKVCTRHFCDTPEVWGPWRATERLTGIGWFSGPSLNWPRRSILSESIPYASLVVNFTSRRSRASRLRDPIEPREFCAFFGDLTGETGNSPSRDVGVIFP